MILNDSICLCMSIYVCLFVYVYYMPSLRNPFVLGSLTK